MISKIEDQYQPARIRRSIRENTNHIKKTDFLIPKLERPKPPEKPELVRTRKLRPLAATLVIIGCLCAVFNVVFAISIPLGIWLWIWDRNQKRKASLVNRETVSYYHTKKILYEEFILKNWSKQQRNFIEEKRQEWLKNALLDALRRKGWLPHSDLEVEETRSRGWIGPGEDEVIAALLKTSLLVHHQVQICKNYTADIVCLNPDSGKMCVVEIDGKQHWDEATKEGLKCIKLDDNRMAIVAIENVDTIRFQNFLAKNNPTECIKHIQQLLA